MFKPPSDQVNDTGNVLMAAFNVLKYWYVLRSVLLIM
jgi:hypothetical protein